MCKVINIFILALVQEKKKRKHVDEMRRYN